MEPAEQRSIIEALLLASSEPVTARRMGYIVPEASAAVVRERIAELNEAYERDGRGFRIEPVGGGFQLRTRPELASYVQALKPSPPLRLSRAALETLAIVAYKQPLTRAEIENVRGVDVGAVLRSLIERRLVRIAGHREVPGRPMLYATSRRFLEVFGLSELSDLPSLREMEELLQERAGEAEESAEEEASDDVDPAALAASGAPTAEDADVSNPQ
ncbi:MAG: SMC-Scp complex subunit ScpB [Myxococcota bacterium]|nr:SMC-Scp complex subunit ScpB [Myxococcota bacterium]